MADLADIRAGIAANIRAKFPDAMVTGYNIANALAPAFEVELDRIVYDQAMSRGNDEWTFTIRGFAASGTDKASQMRLDPWLSSTGAESVKAALESDRTLGGAVSDSFVVSMAKMAVFSPIGGSTDLFGAEWVFRAVAAGD